MFFSFCYGFSDDLGDFGNCGRVGTTSFSFDDFSLEEGEATGTSGGASSRPPRLSQGDPISVFYSLETHAWTVHYRPVSPCLFHCYLLT